MAVHDCGSSQLDHGFYLASSDSLIEDCDIYGNYGNGIQVYTVANDSSRNVIRRNRVHNNNKASATTGIVVGSGDENLVYNNLVYNGGGGIQVRNGGRNNQVLNNTIANNSGGDSGGICLMDQNTNTVVRNNICYNNQTNSLSSTGSTQASNNLFGDPSFVNGARGDFTLAAGSPAIKAGADLSRMFTTDLNGQTRPSGNFDLGALAVGGTGGGAPAGLPAPTNLRIVTSP